MWIVRDPATGEILGGSSNPQMIHCKPALGDWANGKLENPQDLRLLPGPNAEPLKQEWIPDAEYAKWKAARPVVKQRDLLAEIDALKVKIAMLEAK